MYSEISFEEALAFVVEELGATPESFNPDHCFKTADNRWSLREGKTGIRHIVGKKNEEFTVIKRE